jgi:hypothetical protein
VTRNGKWEKNIKIKRKGENRPLEGIKNNKENK